MFPAKTRGFEFNFGMIGYLPIGMTNWDDDDDDEDYAVGLFWFRIVSAA